MKKTRLDKGKREKKKHSGWVNLPVVQNIRAGKQRGNRQISKFQCTKEVPKPKFTNQHNQNKELIKANPTIRDRRKADVNEKQLMEERKYAHTVAIDDNGHIDVVNSLGEPDNNTDEDLTGNGTPQAPHPSQGRHQQEKQAAEESQTPPPAIPLQ